MSGVAHCPRCQTILALDDQNRTLGCPQCSVTISVAPTATRLTHVRAEDGLPDTLDPALGGAARPAAPVPGALVVPGYEIIGELGRGGMGIVYQARDTRLNRPVALKMILRGDTNRGAVARFWAEAEVMAAVQHPNVVQVYELGDHDGHPFMAMEFVSGGSLEDLLDRAALPPRAAAELLAKVAAGVGAAHDLGIVHRDLKPANVLLTEPPAADGRPSWGEPKVTDFGIAKRQSHDLTQTNALMGTPAYMAPEQAAAKAKFVGPPADVWALGVILYECVAGTRPFSGDSVEAVFIEIALSEPRPLRTLARAVPRDLDTIISKCLSKEPEHRYATATELAADLGRLVRGEPIAARPVGSAERFARWVRRKPTAAAAWGFSALAVALALVVFVVFGFWREAEGAKKTAEAAQQTEEGLRITADQARDEAGRARANEEQARRDVEREREKLAALEYGRTIQVAHQAWRDNDIAGALALLEGTKPELRGWEWRYVHRLCNGSLLTLKGHTGPVRGLAFSPDGARLVTIGEDKSVKVWDATTGTELFELKTHATQPFVAVFSPDGTRIFTTGEAVRVWNATTGAEILTANQLPCAYSVALSPDGTRVLTTGADQTGTVTAKVWDAKTGAEQLTLTGHSNGVRTGAFGPDGARALTIGADQTGTVTAKVWDAKTGAAVSTVTLKGLENNLLSAAFSPDGTRVVTSSAESINVWDVKTGAEQLTVKVAQWGAMAVSFSADGMFLVTLGKDSSMVRIWDAKTGTERRTLKGHTGTVHATACSPDGARIATGSSDRTVRVWDARISAEVVTALWNAYPIRAMSFSADGSRVVTGGGDFRQEGEAKVWDARTGAEQLDLKGHTHFVSAVAFSPDGSRVITGSADKTARVWDAKIGIQLLELKGHVGDVTSVSFSADGAQIVTVSGERARVWNAKTGAEVRTTGGNPHDARPLSLNPDGSRGVAGSGDRTAKVWDAKTGAELLTLVGHTGVVSAASFSPDGSRIVTSSSDGTARVWDAKTGAEVLTLKGHLGPVEVVSFSPDGTCIVTGGVGAHVWDATPLDRAFRPREVVPIPLAEP